MDRHDDPQVRFVRMPQTVMAAFSVVYVEAGALKRTKDIETGAGRQPPADTIASLTLTGSARGAAEASLSGIGRHLFLQALKVALDCLGCHCSSFLDGLAIGHEFRQARVRHGEPTFGLRLEQDGISVLTGGDGLGSSHGAYSTTPNSVSHEWPKRSQNSRTFSWTALSSVPGSRAATDVGSRRLDYVSCPRNSREADHCRPPRHDPRLLEDLA